MKAKPYKLCTDDPEHKTAYIPCAVEEATDVRLEMPGPFRYRMLPIILKGSRDTSQRQPVWTWNGDTEKPTIKPSILTWDHKDRCHTWVNDGMAQFLDDCTHEFKGQTIPLLEVAE